MDFKDVLFLWIKVQFLKVNVLKKHKKNKKRHKTRKTQDQTRKITKNNLKINEEQRTQARKFKEKYQICN